MTVANAIEGHMGNGVGQSRLAVRAYMQEISSEPNVIESETEEQPHPNFCGRCRTAM